MNGEDILKKQNDIDEEVLNEEIKEEAEILEKEAKEDIKLTSEEEIGKLKAEVEEWKQAYLRKQADFQNFTKRKEKELDDLRKYASEQIITKLLGEVDDLEKAISASKESNHFEGLVQGLEMILNKIKTIFKNEGVEEISTEGEFDPTLHHAIAVDSNPELKDNEITQELQKGYKMKGKVIRPSMVKVNKKS